MMNMHLEKERSRKKLLGVINSIMQTGMQYNWKLFLRDFISRRKKVNINNFKIKRTIKYLMEDEIPSGTK